MFIWTVNVEWMCSNDGASERGREVEEEIS
jgi:hypothetical protein